MAETICPDCRYEFSTPERLTYHRRHGSCDKSRCGLCGRGDLKTDHLVRCKKIIACLEQLTDTHDGQYTLHTYGISVSRHGIPKPKSLGDAKILYELLVSYAEDVDAIIFTATQGKPAPVVYRIPVKRDKIFDPLFGRKKTV